VTADSARSLEALLLQAAGIAPLAVLSFLLSRSIQREALGYLWRAWTSLVLALLALYLSRRVPPLRPALEALYFLGELVFAGLVIAACGSLTSGPRRGPGRRWLVPAALVAAALAVSHPEFAVRFVPHAAVMALLLVLALRQARRVPSPGRGQVGVPLLRVSLAALSVHLVHYVAVLSWAAASARPLPRWYSDHTALFDLLFQTLLGFGSLIAVMEREHRDLEAANDELRAARERLEAMAHVDPLTASLNRHAFYSMVEGSRTSAGASGCVGVVDLDALKPVNDRFGHAAGDAAIRAVARAIRQVVRADDLVFRWGGDEFLVVLFGVSEEEARRRLEALDAMLAAVPVPGAPEPLALGVSVGVAPFEALPSLEKALEAADERMYRRKLTRRAAAPVAGPPSQSAF
jgi:diguanylate cyclase (GGDEF)-like protein